MQYWCWLCRTTYKSIYYLTCHGFNSTCASCIIICMDVVCSRHLWLVNFHMLKCTFRFFFLLGEALNIYCNYAGEDWRLYTWRTYLRMFLKRRLGRFFDKHGEVTRIVLPAKAGIRGILLCSLCWKVKCTALILAVLKSLVGPCEYDGYGYRRLNQTNLGQHFFSILQLCPIPFYT